MSEKLKYFLLGSMFGAALATFMVLNFVITEDRKIDSIRSKTTALSQKNFDAVATSLSKTMKSLEVTTARLSDCQAKFNHAVILYDVAPGFLGSGESRKRWFIPAQVTPQVIGDPRGAMISFWDEKTQTFDAPRPAPSLPQR